MSLSEQELIRRDKLKQLRAHGIDPYPAPLFPVTHYSEAARKAYLDGGEQALDVTVAGRIMSINDKGKVFFIKIQDAEGLLQLYIKRDAVCPDEDKTLFDEVIKKADLGDIIGCSGYMFTTKTGEVSVHASSVTLLCKSLKPLPVVKRDEEGHVFDEVTDPEFRYRQRYADLIIRPEARDTFRQRSLMIQSIRNFLHTHGALEVDTPVLQNIPGGAAARPFATHHHALDMPFYLRIANELYLKRLIVGGFDFVYEFSRNFRNEGMDRTHNPEFTVLEFYVAYKDYYWLMDFTERMLEQVTMTLHGRTDLQAWGQTLSFKAPFKRISIYDAIQQYTGHDISGLNEHGIRDVCTQLGIATEPSMGRGKLIDELFGETCEKHFVQPTFIMDYPVDMSPLTKKHRDKEGLVERFELIVNGKEIANAYTELNDPLDQRERFEEQVKLMERGDEEAMYIDHDFLRALEYGMPPTAGIGFGIDRLAMLLTDQSSIQDVLFFPQMKPEKTI